MRHSDTTRDADNSPQRYNLKTFVRPNLLLVEGSDEFQFFRFLRPRDDLQIHIYAGKNQLRLELETMRGVEGFDQIKRIAIVRDADGDPQSAMQSVLAQWALALKEVVPKVSSDQWFPGSDGRQWCVWIMPEPSAEGDLEELLWKAVKLSDHRSCIDNLIVCLDACNPVPFGSITKARLYAWLSTQRDPLKELYAAFDARRTLFDPKDTVFSRFAALIDSMVAVL
jgi:hypothetical protein